MTNKQNKGFTLVELLIVVAIIGLLVAIGLPAMQAARRNSRDNARLQSLKGVADVAAGLVTKYGKNLKATAPIVQSGQVVTVENTAGNKDTVNVAAYTMNTIANATACTGSNYASNDQLYYIHDAAAKTLTLCKEDGTLEAPLPY